MAASDELALIQQAGKQRRLDLQDIWDAHIGATTASILALSAAQLDLATDPSMPVMVHPDSPAVGGSNGNATN